MDADDDMVVIIIGEENVDEKNLPFELTIPIKKEPNDEHESIANFADAELYREYEIKEEYYDCEYLEDDYDKKPAPIKRQAAASQSDSNNDEEQDIRVARQSYIEQLCKNFPKMRKDENYLVAHLTEMMKQTIPPIPPVDFCESVNNMFVCSYCKAESVTMPIACRHFQKKHGTRYLVCYACGANYKCTTALYKHEKRCPAPGASLVLKARGRYLGRKGRQRPYLTQDKFEPWSKRNKEATKKRYYCSECTASFGQKEALKSHEYMHRGIRPFQCDQCPVAYTSAIALRRHLQTHSSVQYICDVCGRSFKIKTSLVVHMNTHLPQRKYPCDRCVRRFAQKTALQHHINRDHLNLPPPLACPACPKRFPRVSSLNAHMKAKHGLTLMTRRMFFKALPSMQETELKEATIVFNKELNSSDEESKTYEDNMKVETDLVSEPSDKKVTKTMQNKRKLFAIDTDVERHTVNQNGDIRKVLDKVIHPANVQSETIDEIRKAVIDLKESCRKERQSNREL